MPAYKLTYFDGKGRGEVIRLAFVAGGIKYEDNRVNPPDWPKIKPSEYIYIVYSISSVCCIICDNILLTFMEYTILVSNTDWIGPPNVPICMTGALHF